LGRGASIYNDRGGSGGLEVVWDMEYIAIVPDDYEPEDNEDIMIMDDDFMQEQEG
jgi:hypothetical protein